MRTGGTYRRNRRNRQQLPSMVKNRGVLKRKKEEKGYDPSPTYNRMKKGGVYTRYSASS